MAKLWGVMFTDEMRARLQLALERKGFQKADWPKLCLSAGLHRSYLWTIFGKGRGGIELVSKLCQEIGVNPLWVQTGEGTLESASPPRIREPVNAERMLIALQTVMEVAF